MENELACAREAWFWAAGHLHVVVGLEECEEADDPAHVDATERHGIAALACHQSSHEGPQSSKPCSIITAQARMQPTFCVIQALVPVEDVGHGSSDQQQVD
jgi:hypothetical protein